jgi:death on curing protein
MAISANSLIQIHDLLAEHFADTPDPISPPGVRDRSLLESAAARPQQTIGGRDAYPSPFEKAAALFHSLINNHPFHNGNKRVALVAAHVMLDQSGYWLNYSTDDEMFEFTRRAAAHELTKDRNDELKLISEWFEASARKTVRGEHPMQFGALRDALKKFGFEMDDPHGEFINIYRNGVVVERIIKQGIHGFRPYHTDYISGLRKRLGLTPKNGVDSAKFYGGKGVRYIASQVIDLRIEVIRRLAHT